MLEELNLKIHVFQILQEQNWTELCNILEEKFKLSPNTTQCLHITPDAVAVLSESLRTIKKKLTEQNETYFKTLKEIYKSLRNSVAFNPNGQVLICNSPTILIDTSEILNYLKESEQHDWDSLKMLLQFLINLVINNELVNKKVWNLFKNDLKILVQKNICLYYTSALIYNIFRIDPCLLKADTEIMGCVLDSYKQDNNNEYLTFLLELFIKDMELNKTYINYTVENRMLCLEMMKQMWNNDKSWMTNELLSILSEQFKHKSDCILKTVIDYLKQIEPLEVILLLELLASISSDENYGSHLQADKSLLINCAFLLKSIHSIGKESENNFSVISKLSQVDDDADLEIFQHPSYGFKALVIRLLANLCWKHRENQNLMRELDCIPLLLDCCNIDARNPFIIQWVVFAVRNLCENNLQNQEIIAAMNKQGVVSSDTLNQMGITLHSDEKHVIKIMPLDSNK